MITTELLQEMNALTLRYGVDKCERALKAVKYSSSQQKVVAVRTHRSTVLDMQWPNMGQTLVKLMRWCLNDTIPDKISIHVSGEHFDDDADDHCGRLWNQVRKYSDSIHHFRSIFPSSDCQQVHSRLHTLHLDEVGVSIFEDIFEDMETIALFDKVFIEGEVHDVGLIKELVADKGVISSLRILRSSFDDDEGEQFAEMLEVNRLGSLEMNANVDSPGFALALTKSLQQHTRLVAERSILKQLDLDNTLSGLYPNIHGNLFQDLLDIIGNLPNLESFGILEPTSPILLRILADAIEKWKISHFKLWRGQSDDSDLQALFHSIGSSKHLKVFSISSRMDNDTLPEPWTRPLMNLALSPTCSLLEIELDDIWYHPRDLPNLVPDDCDGALASKRRLRRFCVVPRNHILNQWDESDYQCIFDYLSCLFRLLSKHLPYLYYVGVTDTLSLGQRVVHKNRHPDSDSRLQGVWNDILVQIELNRVGMALLRPDVLPTVPTGLWPTVLYRAVTCEEDPAKRPWTGIYTMVRALVEDGHTGWSNYLPNTEPGRKVSAKRRRQESDS